MGIAEQENSELMPVLKKGEIYLKTIERLNPTKVGNCQDFINRLRALHKKYGKKHLVKNKKISDKTFTDRWQQLHQTATDLYALGFYLEQPTKIVRKHCIALCKAWETAGYSASAIANKKTGLRTLLAWSGREAVIDDIKLEDLFEDPRCIYRPTKTTVDKSMSAGLSKVDLEDMFGINTKDVRQVWCSQPLMVIEHLHKDVWQRSTGGMQKKLHDEKFVLMLKIMYWFGLRAAEAASFRPNKDVMIDASGKYQFIRVIRKGAKGGKQRKVNIYDPHQVVFLKELRAKELIKNGALAGYKYKLASFERAFHRFTKSCGLTKENNMCPHSLRHEYAQSLLEFFTGEPSPIRRNGKTLDKRLLKQAKGIVSEQLGHHRAYITGAYTG